MVIPDSKLTWFKINPSIFLTSTVGMSNQDVGAYIKLLAYSWINGPLPNNPKVLSSIAGKGNMDVITARFFEVDGDGKLCDPRLEASRTEAATILDANRKRTENGRKKALEEARKKALDEALLQASHKAVTENDSPATATDNNDKDKGQLPESDKGQLPDKERTGQGQAAAPTLPPKPSVTLDKKILAGSVSGQKSNEAHGPNWED